MPLEFEKGKIGHVQWVWVDATDFATIESALVQPASCVLFGWLNGNSANGSVVASGSSGLTKSAVTLRSGVIQLAVPTADMSDSQNDFYDRYMFHASLTGAAQIWIPIKGNRVPSSELSNYLSNTSDVFSDILSAVQANDSSLSGISDKISAVSDAVDQTNSRVLLTLSLVSDVDSQLLVTHSLLSDVDSQLLLNASVISDVQSALDSQFLVYRSDISDVKSELSDTHSDLRSMISGITVSVGASDISDIASAVWAAVVTTHGAGAGEFGSLVRNTKSLASDIGSALTSQHSDVVSKLSDLLSVASDAHSAAILAASHASDAFSVAVINRSLISDVDSALSSQFAALSNQISAFQSDVKSEFDNIATTVSASDISDIVSAVWSEKYNVHSAVPSSFGSFVVQQTQGASNLLSNISGLTSDAHSAAILAASHASDAQSQALIASSRASDAHSMAVANSDAISNVISMLIAMGGPEHIASLVWDADKGSYIDASSMGSVLQAGTATPSATADKVWSDFESKVGASISNVVSFLSTVVSDAHSAAILAASHASDAQSMAAGNSDAISNVLSMLTAMGGPEHIASLVWDADKGSYLDASSMGSVLQAGTATPSATADKVWSDFESKVGASISNVVSFLSTVTSDAHSAAILAASHASDAQSMAAANSDAISNVLSMLTAMGGPEHIASLVWDADKGSYIDASSMGSVLQTGTASPSAIADKVWSDFGSKVGASVSNVVSFLSTVTSDAHSAAILAASHASDAHSMAVANSAAISDLQSDMTSQFAGLSANISDIESQIDAGVSISAGGITSASFTAGALDAAALATDAAEEIADEVLDRNLAGGGSGGTRNVRNALRSLRNRQQIAASVLRVFEENDTTTAWSATISTASGDPLVEIDP